MPKSDMIEARGEVIAIHRGGYTVLLENDHEVLAKVSGKMRMNHIKIILGDEVDLDLSPYDLTKGRITYRHK